MIGRCILCKSVGEVFEILSGLYSSSGSLEPHDLLRTLLYENVTKREKTIPLIETTIYIYYTYKIKLCGTAGRICSFFGGGRGSSGECQLNTK